MQDCEYNAWTQHHSRVLGIADPINELTFQAWRKFFEVLDCGADDLEAASNHLGASGSSARPAEQLASITRFLRDRISIEYKREAEQHEQERGDCVKCRGIGRVIVPHVAGLKDGEWRPVQKARSASTYYTMAVLCDCALGRWMRQKYDAEKCPMFIETYSLQNPRWPQQLRQRSLEYAMQVEATGVSPKAEEVQAILVAAIDHRMRQAMGEV